MKRLVLTVGLPRSGKSSWARSTGWPIVNPDSIRLAVHGTRFFAPVEPLVWAIAHIMADSLLMSHGTVIVDACNVTQARRDEWLKHDCNVEFQCLDTSAEECIRRAEDDEEIISVIQRMAQQWDFETPLCE